MEEIKLYCRGSVSGRATMREIDGRLEILGEMPDPGDGLYRAVLAGERGELSLGVLEPQEGKLVLRRRPALCDIAPLGAVRSIRIVCSFPFRKKTQWHQTSRPEELFRDPFLRERAARQPLAWWQREDGRLTVAFPLKPDAAFPLEALFCFARAAYAAENLCAVFTFDASDVPIRIANR